MPADAPEGQKRGLDFRKTALLLTTLTGVVGGIAYYNWDSGEDKTTPPDPSLRRKLELKGEACGSLVKTKQRLGKLAGNRKQILDRLSVLGKCTDPEAIEFNFQGVCTQITEGIKAANPKWMHPILNPFYVSLYDELKCAKNEHGDNMKPEIEALYAALQTTDAIKQYRPLNPELKIDEICRDAVNLIKFPPNIEAIKDIAVFVLGIAPTLPPNSGLREVVERSKQSFREKNAGKEPTDADLKGILESYLSIAVSSVKIPGLCLLPAESLIGFFNKNMTPEMLTEKRRLILPHIRELLSILKDAPETDETKRVSAAILRLAQSMSAPKKP